MTSLKIPGDCAAAFAAELARPLTSAEQALVAELTAPALVLTKPQAEAIRAARTALHAADMAARYCCKSSFDAPRADRIVFVEYGNGAIHIFDADIVSNPVPGGRHEDHASFAGFATAYGLENVEPGHTVNVKRVVLRPFHASEWTCGPYRYRWIARLVAWAKTSSRAGASQRATVTSDRAA